MNIAKKYLKKQLTDEEFRHSYLEERVKLDIEYQLEELKEAVKSRKRVEELIKKIDSIERYLMSA